MHRCPSLGRIRPHQGSVCCRRSSVRRTGSRADGRSGRAAPAAVASGAGWIWHNRHDDVDRHTWNRGRSRRRCRAPTRAVLRVARRLEGACAPRKPAGFGGGWVEALVRLGAKVGAGLPARPGKRPDVCQEIAPVELTGRTTSRPVRELRAARRLKPSGPGQGVGCESLYRKADRASSAETGVAAMTLGIVVDDTVHFLSKYRRARRELGCAHPARKRQRKLLAAQKRAHARRQAESNGLKRGKVLVQSGRDLIFDVADTSLHHYPPQASTPAHVS